MMAPSSEPSLLNPKPVKGVPNLIILPEKIGTKLTVIILNEGLAAVFLI